MQFGFSNIYMVFFLCVFKQNNYCENINDEKLSMLIQINDTNEINLLTS